MRKTVSVFAQFADADGIAQDIEFATISRARLNMDRTDLEATGVIDRGEAGDKAWSNFGRDMDTFILKLPQSRRAALAEAIQQQSGRAGEWSH